MFEIFQAGFAAGASLALLAFAGITLGGSVVASVISTPLFLIFSPVLVPATIATTLLATGFTASASLAATALTIILWIYRKYSRKEPPKPAAPESKPAESGK